MKSILKGIWKKVISDHFNKGFIAYERQLQAHLFHELKNVLDGYFICVEPYMFIELKHELDGTMPDMIIANSRKQIVAVIELKCQPWGNVRWERDIEKLAAFERLKIDNWEIPLMWSPKSSNWNHQKDSETKFSFYKDCVFVFGVIGKQHCSAVNELKPSIDNFLHLSHWIEKDYT